MPKKEARSKGYHSPHSADAAMLSFTDSREDYGRVETLTPGSILDQHETSILSGNISGQYDAI